MAYKIMESIIRDAMVGFLDANALIKSTQHGLMRNRSCLTNILEFLEDITGSVDNNNDVDVVVVRFPKSFR